MNLLQGNLQTVTAEAGYRWEMGVLKKSANIALTLRKMLRRINT